MSKIKLSIKIISIEAWMLSFLMKYKTSLQVDKCIKWMTNIWLLLCKLKKKIPFFWTVSDEFVTISVWANHHNIISFCWHHSSSSDLFHLNTRAPSHSAPYLTNKEVLGHRYVLIIEYQNGETTRANNISSWEYLFVRVRL